MPGFPYKSLSGPDEIRVLVLKPSSDPVADLRGSLKTIKLPQNEPTPVTFDSPVSSGLSAKWKWEHARRLDRAVYTTNKNGEKELVEGSPGFGCPRENYLIDEYDALSYTWDNEEKPCTIQIGKHAMSIGSNLNSALLNLRDAACIRVIWVDSICINQVDVRERNHQVHMMKHIYSNAASVVVWLGLQNAASLWAVVLIIRCNSRSSRPNDNILKQDAAYLAGLPDIFLRRWWKRIWIVQEVVAARELVIFCGRFSFPWNYVRRVCAMIRKEEFSSAAKARFLRSSGYQNFTALDEFRKARGTMGLAKYLQCTKDYEATDVRDKLYALIGVSCDISPEDIVPDYEKSTRTVFLDLVRFLVTRRRSLDVISSGRLSRPARTVQELQLEDPQGDIPSWLPDWRVSKGLRALDSEGEDGASYRAGSDAEAVVRMDRFPLLLEVEGIVVDNVEFFGGAITSPAHKSLPTLQRWKYIAGNQLRPDNCGRTAPAFWDTIVAGRVDRRRQSPNNTRSYGGLLATPAAELNSEQELWKGSAEYKNELRSFVAESMFPPEMARYYMDAVTRAVMGRRFFITKKKRMGLGVPEIQINDQVVVVKGCSVPLIMRAVEDHMVIIGESYVSETMDGEVIRGLASGQYKSRMIKLR